MTLPRPMAATFALLVAGLLVPFTMAEENLGWHGGAHEGGATLFYGIPQSDHTEISFSCQAGSDAATFVFAFAPIMAVDGVEVDVILEAGDIAVPIHTTGMLMEMDDQFLLEGQVAVDMRLIDLLTSRGILSVFVEDGAAEYPLDGAREAATALIEACGPDAATAAVESCAFHAWVESDGRGALAIREGAAGDATAISDIPGPYPGYDGLAYPTARVTGHKAGWFRIDEIVTNLYAEGEAVVAFAGEGWVPGKALALYVESPVLFESPSYDAAVTADFGGDTMVVDRLYACQGHWVEVGGTSAGSRVRGWSSDTCESQITTCP